MIRVWKDGRVPIEFHAPALKFENFGKIGVFGNFLSAVSPLIVIVLSLVFVQLSFYAAPKTIIVKDSPVVYPPTYFVAVGHVEKTTTGANPTTSIASFLYERLPLFETKRMAFPMYTGATMSAFVSSNVLDITLRLPYQLTATTDTGTSTTVTPRLKQVFVMIPLTVQFPGIAGRLTHSVIQFETYSTSEFDDVEYFGRLGLEQKKTLVDGDPFANMTIDQVLDGMTINRTQGFTVNSFLNVFKDSSFSVRLSKTAESQSMTNQGFIRVHLSLRIPELFASVEAPFWNMFKETYVQLFYWFWLIYYIWNKFLVMGFRYGVIPSTIRYPLKNTKQHAD